ncbi:gamma-tubulin ring complex protein [Dichomitus squalens LYAD-421 SS1]|uniref:gamma-tubulin ring complex protein n=1 Tax=Dichomitus squalens (strain LYAD-421) TaxID=732165 RepID=UPI0004412869|nr:gamma-tubulin ring complex protein [Dichomitus squalens LYAD-421 SS1]EJF67192.1 gamma-tubulin ring complex protein [Dichomitus squalens LYAD-421 SS1]
MIAEVLLVLAGHSSSLFPTDHKVHPAFAPLLHPGEEQCLESLGQIALRYRKIKDACSVLARPSSRYVSALCATLNQILKDEYEVLVVETEAKVLKRDSSLVASGSFVPLSSLRAIFAEWDAPLASLETLVDDLQAHEHWRPGPLIDLLLTRSQTGIHRVSSIYARLSEAVQRVWIAQLQAVLIHGTLSPNDPLADKNYVLVEGAVPSCVSVQSRDSITYVGRAIGTVKAAKWEKQFPQDLAREHTKLLNTVIPQDQYAFDRVISDIRTAVSEWLWLNVLTHKDVDEAVESLANYFLLRNGEFALSLIREIERLKLSRLTGRSVPSTMIREQDLHLALLRASLGTTAQQDPSLANLHFRLPTGPIRPLLPSLAGGAKDLSASLSSPTEPTSFDDLLLGTPLVLAYDVSWPLDLFLHASDLQLYAALFSYLSALRKTHTRIHTCWTALSNAQRARRRWTGLGEGGTAEDLEVRKQLLRCGWGIVREMTWFLDTLLGYVMTDVVDVEFRRLKSLLSGRPTGGVGRQMTGSGSAGAVAGSGDDRIGAVPLGASKTGSTFHPSLSTGSNLSSGAPPLDFTTLRSIHATYLERLLTGSLLANPALTNIIRMILEVCERFAAQVERWGGDVLPALLFEGSLAAGGGDKVGEMVAERYAIVGEIDVTLHTLLDAFYEQLSLSTTLQPFSATIDATKSMLYNASMTNTTGFGFHTFVRTRRGKRLEGDEEVRRHVERLLLRLDFNGQFSKPSARRHGTRSTAPAGQEDILKQGGLA